MTPGERIGAYHLLWVWAQYGNFDHQCASAGEDACDWLESLGLAVDTGWGIEPTEAGLALMEATDIPGVNN